jgi:L-fucose mutarotase
MLKGIPKIISPELMKILMEMGHGDEIVISDGNFPAASCAKRLVRCDGHGVPELLESILKFFPLDTLSDKPISLMAVAQDEVVDTTIWEDYKKIVEVYDSKAANFQQLERFKFYERAKNAYAVIATSEAALYANLILKKGVV